MKAEVAAALDGAWDDVDVSIREATPVRCPRCNERVDGWFHDAMRRASAGDFSAFEGPMPCCTTRVAMTEFRARWPSGLAQFAIVVGGSEPARFLEDEELARVVRAVGCDVRQALSRA